MLVVVFVFVCLVESSMELARFPSNLEFNRPLDELLLLPTVGVGVGGSWRFSEVFLLLFSFVGRFSFLSLWRLVLICLLDRSSLLGSAFKILAVFRLSLIGELGTLVGTLPVGLVFTPPSGMKGFPLRLTTSLITAALVANSILTFAMLSLLTSSPFTSTSKSPTRSSPQREAGVGEWMAAMRTAPTSLLAPLLGLLLLLGYLVPSLGLSFVVSCTFTIVLLLKFLFCALALAAAATVEEGGDL